MKIEFDKALLWLIPYLYLVSVLYYWGYWGTLGVDVFNYYPVSDLIKGITAPLRITLTISVATGLCLMAMKWSLENIEKKQGQVNKWGLLIIFILAITALAIRYYLNNNKTYYELNLEIWDDVIVTAFLVVMVCSFFINKNFKQVSKPIDYLRFSFLCFIFILPIESLYDGHHTAIRIDSNHSFIYLITNIGAKKKSIYKYLGKVGDYQVLETLDNYQTIILPASELKPLVLESYTRYSPLTLNRFRLHARELSLLPHSQKSNSTLQR